MQRLQMKETTVDDRGLKCFDPLDNRYHNDLRDGRTSRCENDTVHYCAVMAGGNNIGNWHHSD